MDIVLGENPCKPEKRCIFINHLFEKNMLDKTEALQFFLKHQEFVPLTAIFRRHSGTVNTEIPPRQAWESWMLKKIVVFSLNFLLFLDEVLKAK